jgi:hypothetical protein
MTPANIFLISLIGFGLMLFVDAHQGWWTAARKWRATKLPLMSPYLRGVVRVGNALLVGHSFAIKPTSEGVFIDPPLFFRLFHAPLLIPWDALKEYRPGTGGFCDRVSLTFDLPNGPRVKISPNSLAWAEIQKFAPINLSNFQRHVEL